MAAQTLFEKILLSGSTTGKNIKVVQTATAGTLIHTAHATSYDEIWLWALNTSAAPVVLTIEWGGVASPDDTDIITVPSKGGWILVEAGFVLTNSLVVRAFAASANVVTIKGFVNRMT